MRADVEPAQCLEYDLVNEGLDPIAVGVDLETGMQTGGKRMRRQQALAECVDRRHPQSVDLVGNGGGARTTFVRTELRHHRPGAPVDRLITVGEVDQRVTDPARHLGGSRFGEGDRHHPLDHPLRRLRRRPVVGGVAVPASTDAPGGDAGHEQRGLAGSGAGLDDERPAELGLCQRSRRLVLARALKAAGHRPASRSTPSHHRSRAAAISEVSSIRSSVISSFNRCLTAVSPRRHASSIWQ